MKLQNLNDRIPITNPDGTPTQYFIRLLQTRGILQGDDSELLHALAETDFVADAPLIGGGIIGEVDPDNPEIHIGHDTSGVTPGIYGDTGYTPKLTVDEYGHITGVEDVASTGGVSLEQAGAPVAGGPFSVLNFNSGATVTNAGAGEATIAISGGGGGGNPWWWAPPVATDFPVYRQSGGTTATLSDDSDVGLVMSFIAPENQRKLFLKAVPLATDFQFQAHFNLNADLTSFTLGGIALLNDTNGRLCWAGARDGTTPLTRRSDSLAGVFTSETNRQAPQGPPQWLRCRYITATTTIAFDVSADGKYWTEWTTGTTTTFLNAAGNVPQYVGFGLATTLTTAGRIPTISIDHWSQSW